MRVAVALYVLALLVRGLLALPIFQPGYMDEAYYFVNALTLARGGGFNENFVWNYLTHPSTLPQPGNAYWMPLTSILLAPVLWLAGAQYRAAQAEMLCLSALLVPLTYLVSLRLFANRRWALWSALLMLFSGLYLSYWAASDSFTLFALLGVSVLLLAPRLERAGHALVCGALIGLAHLTRADGFLLAAPCLYLWWRHGRPVRPLAAVLFGYAVVMLPWFARNVAAFGSPLVGGGTVFMRAYNDLFLYEQPLTLDYWLGAGWSQIWQNIVRALVLNLATLAGSLHFVFFPFALIGLWRERARDLARGVVVYLLALFALMTLVFSLSGPRGAFLHSLVAPLPLLYVFAPLGLHAAVAWIARRRTAWQPRSAELVFGTGFLALAVLVSLSFYRSGLAGGERDAGWNERFSAYPAVAAFLAQDTRDVLSPVMCIAPPAFVYFTGRAAIAVPSDDPLALIHAAQQFAARYVIVEPDHPAYLDGVYSYAFLDQRFQLRATFADARGAQVQLYQIVPLR